MLNGTEGDNPTWRQQKGYEYEMEIQDALERRKIPHTGNPKDMKEWLKQQGQHRHPPDTSIPLLGIKAELKVTDGKVFHSWFKRDWIPRAEHSDVFVCTNKWKVCEWGRGWLKEHHIKLFDTGEFLEFIEKKWRQLINRNKIIESIEGNIIKIIELVISVKSIIPVLSMLKHNFLVERIVSIIDIIKCEIIEATPVPVFHRKRLSRN